MRYLQYRSLYSGGHFQRLGRHLTVMSNNKRVQLLVLFINLTTNKNHTLRMNSFQQEDVYVIFERSLQCQRASVTVRGKAVILTSGYKSVAFLSLINVYRTQGYDTDITSEL